MASRSSNRGSTFPFPPRRTLTPEEQVLTRWPEASLRKRAILVKRYQDLWGALDESIRAQMNPSPVEDRKPPEPPDVEPPSTTRPPLDLSHVDLLTGTEFEKFIGKEFEQKGYMVEYHGGPAEAGGDLVCWEGSTERVHAILVQVKRERSLTGTKAISQIIRKENWFRHRYPDASYEKWVITSSGFSRQARTEAEVGRITLIDREVLQKWLAER